MRELFCEIPEGIKGDWEVKRFEVTQQAADREGLRASVNPSCMGRGHIESGIYTRLTHKGELIMSDAPDEMDDFRWFVSRASGTILVNGLGLGMTVKALLQNQRVKQVVVVEIDQDVIDLVGSHLMKKWGDGVLEIVHADALTWKNPMKYKFNWVWHDIWPNICADNLPSMKKLHRKCGHWLAPNGTQESWSRNELEGTY